MGRWTLVVAAHRLFRVLVVDDRDGIFFPARDECNEGLPDVVPLRQVGSQSLEPGVELTEDLNLGENVAVNDFEPTLLTLAHTKATQFFDDDGRQHVPSVLGSSSVQKRFAAVACLGVRRPRRVPDEGPPLAHRTAPSSTVSPRDTPHHICRYIQAYARTTYPSMKLQIQAWSMPLAPKPYVPGAIHLPAGTARPRPRSTTCGPCAPKARTASAATRSPAD